MTLESTQQSRRNGYAIQSGVVIRVSLNGHSTQALLDSGAQPSVVDIQSLRAISSEYTPKRGRVHGVCATPVKTVGEVILRVDVGKGETMEHKFTVLDSSEPTIILGRDFLSRYSSTEFNWDNHRVRLGNFWLNSEATISGGQALSRAELVATTVCDTQVARSSTNIRWNISPDITSQQSRRLAALLEEFHDVFAENPRKPSITTRAQHLIETGGSQPVKARSVRVSPQVKREINTQVTQMLENGVIRQSSSPWASRVILVQKKDMSYRFAVDYRALNDQTKKDSYPLPDVKDILDKLQGSTFFSSLDDASAYWSIPIVEPDREKTAFIVPRGQFEFYVMLFGLCNAQVT